MFHLFQLISIFFLYILFNCICNKKYFKENGLYILGFAPDNVEFVLQTISFKSFEDEYILLFIDDFYKKIAPEIWTVANLSLLALNIPDDYLIKAIDSSNDFKDKISSFVYQKNSDKYFTFYRENYFYNFYFNYGDGVSLYYFDVSHMTPFCEQISNKFLKTINGFICRVDFDDNIYDFFISSKNYNKIMKILKAFEINSYKMITNSNYIFILSSNFLLVYPTYQNNYDLCEDEKNLLFIRHKDENEFLNEFLNIQFVDYIKGDVFEELIYDILERDKPRYRNVRFVANTFEPDGGRDLICEVFKGYNVDGSIYDKAIVQCKSYSKNLSKREVNDLRDLLEHYTTKKYILFSKSKLTKNLTEYLEKLNEQGYDVVWYTEREIINEIKKSDYLINKYKDVLILENLGRVDLKNNE